MFADFWESTVIFHANIQIQSRHLKQHFMVYEKVIYRDAVMEDNGDLVRHVGQEIIVQFLEALLLLSWLAHPGVELSVLKRFYLGINLIL